MEHSVETTRLDRLMSGTFTLAAGLPLAPGNSHHRVWLAPRKAQEMGKGHRGHCNFRFWGRRCEDTSSQDTPEKRQCLNLA